MPKIRSIETHLPTRVNPTAACFTTTMNTFTRAFCSNNDTEKAREVLVSAKKPRDMAIRDFVAQVKQLNWYLAYLPGPLNQRLGDEEMLAIIRRSVPHWNESLIRSAQSVTTLQALTTYYQDLEELEISRQHCNQRREAQSGNRNPGRARGERREHRYQLYPRSKRP
jgi:hypothetical protein